MTAEPAEAKRPLRGEHLFFVTGRLASRALQDLLEEIAPRAGFDYSIETLPITVAALMTTEWIGKRWHVPAEATRVVLPGYCLGDIEPLAADAGVPVERGPRDLRELPDWLGTAPRRSDDYGGYDIQIIAEINHAPQLTVDEILAEAARLRADGADLIDVGCEPTGPWRGVGSAVAALRAEGHRVSIDSLDPREIAPAAEAGAELVLSVNSANREAAADWGCEVVVIPDDFATLGGLDETVELLEAGGVPFRIDPVLEPIGMGLAASLARYAEVRRRYGQAEMMMGIGNLSELTDVDSAGVNVLLLGICQELEIRSVLTTQVINWARTSVKECDLARRLVHYAVRRGVVPKHLEPRLVMLRDAKLLPPDAEQLGLLAGQLKDHNYRLFADGELLHVVAAGLHLRDEDPYELFDQLCQSGADGEPPKNLSLSHAFYLGYELAKATTANTLGKQYRQDEALDWGVLTRSEASHLQRRKDRRR